MTPKFLSFAALTFVLLAGCMSTGPQARITISGGEKILIDLKTGSVAGAKPPLAKVRIGGLMVDAKTKQACYTFSLEFNAGDVPARVKVEDVSERTAVVLTDDAQPKLNGRFWAWKSDSFGPEDQRLHWIHDLDDSVRVFRFTIVLADGRENIQYQSSYYAGFMKARLRTQFGLEG